MTAIDPSQPLDPKRPWITDPGELPGAMSWLSVYFDPAGRSPRLHFTRGWLVLAIIAIPTLVLAIWFQFSTFSGRLNWWLLAPLVLLGGLTTLATFSLHMRRIRDAGKSPFWVVIVLLPALAVLGSVATGVASGQLSYRKIEAMRAYQADKEGLKARDPQAYALAEKTIAEQREAAQKRAREGGGEANARRRGARGGRPGGARRGGPGGRRGGPGRGGGRGGPGAGGGPSEVMMVALAISKSALPAWAITSLIAMLWSLFGPARWATRL